MNKKIVSIIIFVSLFCITGLALAQATIPNPLQGVDNFCQLLTKIAAGAGEVIASLAVVMLIISGILFLTSAGSAEKMGTAKKALMYAIIGLIVGLSAQAVVGIVKEMIGASGGSC